jgi:poly(3-hydroxybutyrate) depolymerase
MADRRPAEWNQWAEVVGRDARKPRFVGDMPHGWVASDFIRSTLDLFAYERDADHALVVGAGVPLSWLDGAGVSVKDLRTPYGTLGYTLRRRGGRIVLDVARGSALPPGGIVYIRADGTELRVDPPGAARPWKLQEGQHPMSFEARGVKKASSRFLLYLPRGFADGGRKWPLMIFLHGSGEAGSDPAKVKVNGPPMIAEGRDDFPFILVSPQAADESGFDVRALDALLDQVLARLPVDPDRVYLTGLSMGGYDTWRWGSERPGRFAAIAPVCGSGDVQRACRLKSVPVWAFHGAKDDVVPIGPDQAMVDAVRACGGDALFTIYPEGNHNAWTETYANPKLYEWLLGQRRTRP